MFDTPKVVFDCSDVMDMYRLPIDDGTANDGAAIAGTGFANCPGGGEAIRCDNPISIIFDANDGDIRRSTNARRIPGNDIQYRLNRRRGASDHTQNFTRGSLLLQQLLQLVEQPHVLDGDHRLVGEGLKQFYLRWGEGAYL